MTDALAHIDFLNAIVTEHRPEGGVSGPVYDGDLYCLRWTQTGGYDRVTMFSTADWNVTRSGNVVTYTRKANTATGFDIPFGNVDTYTVVLAG